jgi:hypothetical protein
VRSFKLQQAERNVCIRTLVCTCVLHQESFVEKDFFDRYRTQQVYSRSVTYYVQVWNVATLNQRLLRLHWGSSLLALNENYILFLFMKS